MNEFELIDCLLRELGDVARGGDIVVGPGDDAALVALPARCVAVASIDTLVAGVHFPPDAPADLIGQRALGVSVSDLAAMGAQPQYALIALTLQDDSELWLTRFAAGVAAAARRLGIKVAGGNLARGPLSVSVSVHGWCESDTALLRSGAAIGDLVCVSGSLGGAALALTRADLCVPPDAAALAAVAPADPCYALQRYYLPQPRVALGRALRGIATAAIDVSDGLAADLGHLCRASGVGACIDLDAVPRVAGASAELAVTGGDDYELCFTIAPDQRNRLSELPGACVVVGVIEAGDTVVAQRDGVPVVLGSRGFRHFG